MDTQYVRTTGTRVLLGLVLSLLLILMDGMGWIQPVYGAGSFIVEPVTYWARRSVQSIENVVGTIASIGELRGRNAELALEVSQLRSEVGAYRELERENEVLRSQLGIALTKEWTLVQSRILSIDRYGSAEHVIIDVGFDDGVSEGDTVILGDLLIGTIREVFPSTSRVRLVSNQDSNIYAVDQNTSAKGLVHGSLDGVVMEEILESETVKEGDIVVTWQDDIPGGLVLGLITEIVDIPTSSTKRAYLEPGFSLEDVQYVFVVTEY